MLGGYRSGAAVLLNRDAAEHLVSHVHATVDQADSNRADALRPGRARYGARRRRGLRSRLCEADRTAVGIDVIEVVDARGVELLQACQGVRGASRGVQHHDVSAELRGHRLAQHRKSCRAGRLQRGSARRQGEQLPAHHGRAVRVGLEHVPVPAQLLANPQGTQFPQAARIDFAREHGGGFVDIQHAGRGHIRQCDAGHRRHTHGGQTDLCERRRRDQQQQCRYDGAHASTIVERGRAGKKWKKMALMNVMPA